MENLRNFVVIEFHDGIDVVNKHWRIDDNTFYFPSGVKDRVEYFKLINSMVSPGYRHEKYDWSPRYVIKVHSSDELFDEAITKLEMTRLFDSSEDEANKRSSLLLENRIRNEDLLHFAMSSPSSPELGVSTSGRGRDVAGASYALPARLSPTPFCTFMEPKTDKNRGPYDFLGDRHSLKDITGPSIARGTYTSTMAPALDSDTLQSSNKTFKTSTSGFLSKVAKDGYAGKTRAGTAIDDDGKDGKQHLTTNQIASEINSKLTKLMANQEHIIGLINRVLKKKPCNVKQSLSSGMFTDELEDYFASKFPLKSMDDVDESENMLYGQSYYYTFLKSKLLSFVGSNNLNFATKLLLTKLLTNRIATRISFNEAANKKCAKCKISKETERTINLENTLLYTLILDVITSTFDCDKEQINVPIRGWLFHAKDRYDRKKNTNSFN